ncbi:MAG TPA: methyltransferase domain-containing protein [Anaeromyxobacter sp.]|nr:methyltransferase domain-containing protein [Anaeromyxobacter sp.]
MTPERDETAGESAGMNASTTSAREDQAAIAARHAALAPSRGALSCGSALDRAAPAPGETVVDLGCGRGQDVVRAAALVREGGHAIGVDLSAEVLAKARRLVPKSLSNVRFVRSGLAPLDLPPAVADVVISSCAIHDAPDTEAVYREIHRVLRPGGRFVVSDVVAEEAPPEAVRSDRAAGAARHGGAIPEAEYVGAARRAGFEAVEVLERSAPYEQEGVRLRSLTLKGTRR